MLIGFAPTAAGRRHLARLEAEARDPYYLQLRPAGAGPPTSLVNLCGAKTFPRLLGLMVIVFAQASWPTSW